MSKLDIKKVLALPGTLEPDTLYLVKNTSGELEIHMSTTDGSQPINVPSKSEILNAIAIKSATQPPLPNDSPIWVDTISGLLYVQQEIEGVNTWVTTNTPKLLVSRVINGTNFDGSVDITTANWGTSRVLTVGGTSKAVNGSGDIAWSLAEIGVPSLTGTGATGTWAIDVTGSAASAGTSNKLTTARLINGTSFNGTIDIITSVWGVSRNITIGNTVKSVNGSVDSEWTLGEIGAPAVNGSGAIGTWAIGITGNAATATVLQTARTINGTSFNGSAAITTANWGTSRTVTIGSTAKSINGAADISWTLADIGAPSLTGVGASGSWAIAITGNAATATAFATARSIALGTGVTGTATSFNGSANIVIPVTNVDASYLLSGTVPDARLTGIYSGFTHKLNNGTSVISSPSTGSTSPIARTVYGLAEYRGSTTTVTGAIVFIAPNALSSIMHQMHVKGLLFNNSIVDFTVQGYRTSGVWSDERKVNLGTADIQVRWGVTSDGKNCLILGDVSTVWSYPHMSIVSAMFSHTNVADSYCVDWSVALVTDLTLYTNVTSTINVTPSSIDISGTAATATKLATTRTISLTGDVTGSVSFDGSANAAIAATIAANSVALGTDTTGNYVATVAVSGTGLSVSGSGSETAAVTITSNATNTNTASTVVARDASGNFSAGTITATLSGNATTATTASSCSGNATTATTATNVSGGAVNATTGTFSGAVTGTSFNSITGLSSTTPVVNGTAAVGAGTTAARADHVHPTDTTRAAVGQTMYIGTTAFTINRASAAIALTGITSIDGLAATASKLATARTIGINSLAATPASVSFDGSTNISIPAPAVYSNITTTLDTGVSGYGNSMGMVSATDGPGGNGWYRFIQMSYNDVASNVWQSQIALKDDTMYYRSRHGGTLGTTGWNSWITVLTSGNYNSYVPTLNGTGATGTWGINISGTAALATSAAACTGNSATTTKLATARTINGTSFNGSAAITTANWGTARTITIGSTGKSVNGSAAVSWSHGEIGIPYDLSGGIIGLYPANATIFAHVVARPFYLPAGLSGSIAISEAAASGAVSFTIYKNGVSIGAINFAAGATSATFSFASTVTFVFGDKIKIMSPAADATLSDFMFNLLGAVS